MCGRYALINPPDAVRQAFGYREQPNFPPRYNIAPTQPVPVVTNPSGSRQFVLMRWGFLPGWVRDPKDYPLVINVRGESAREKPSFRAAFTRRRCLMPADGFYEWHRLGSDRRPYLFRQPDRGVFAFAALWETWHSPDGSEIDTVAMMTGPANGLMAAIHHRCPIILDEAQQEAWLDPSDDGRNAATLLKPPPDDLLEMVRVSPAVNKVANDGPQVQQPESEAAPAETPAARPRRAKVDADQGSLF